MSGPRISAHGLGKTFCTGFQRSLCHGAQDILSDLFRLRRRANLRAGEFWALRDVSMTLHAGEAVAIIGHNGAGKTTLLRILQGIIRPDAGGLRVEGRAVALIDLGIGLNPLLTGRENIRLSARLHGLDAAQAEAVIPAALDFADLHDHADTVVQSYSTGMRSRLAYAVATRLGADVLLIDEVLAVGDLSFQRKCIAHMQRFLADGGSLLLVSHALHHIQAVCSRAILLDGGQVVAQGDVGEVIDRYLATRPVDGDATPQRADAPFRVTAMRLTGPDGAARSGGAATLRLEGFAHEPLNVYAGFGLWSEDGWTCITTTFDKAVRRYPIGPVAYSCAIAQLPLTAGRYQLRPMIADSVAHALVPLCGPASGGALVEIEGERDKFAHAQRQVGQLVVVQADWAAGSAGVAHTWQEKDCST